MILKTLVPAVTVVSPRHMNVESSAIEVEIYEDGRFLCLGQDDDFVTLEPAQLKAIIEAAKRAGWAL